MALDTPATLPWREIRVGSSLHSPYRLLGAAGLVAGAAVHLGLGLARGLDPAVTGAISVAMFGGFVGWGLLRRRLVGREETVLLEHLWLAALVIASAAGLLGRDPLVHLDVGVVGLTVLLAFGRVGCTLGGCCHGLPSSLGLRYRREPEGTLRRFPVQPIEAASWAVLGLAGAWMSAPPGLSTALVLSGYGLVRFALESVRGDSRRHWLGISQGRWMAAATGVAGVALGSMVLGGGLRELLLLAGSGAVLGLLAATRGAWLAPSETLDPGLEREVRAWAAGLVRGPEGLQAQQLDLLRLAASWEPEPPRWVVSASSPDLGSAFADRVFELVADELGAARSTPRELVVGAWFVVMSGGPVPAPRLTEGAPAQKTGYFARPPEGSSP
jgi:phosphatidylglycerol:prolipoprotein diacylglycerol transferase